MRQVSTIQKKNGHWKLREAGTEHEGRSDKE